MGIKKIKIGLKFYLFKFSFILFFSGSIFSQELESILLFKNIIQTQNIYEFFDGQFTTLGIDVKDTKEKFLVIDSLGKLKLRTTTFFDKNIDFVLSLNKENIFNMVKYAEDGYLNLEEQFKIMRVFFTPFTKVTLKKSPVLSNNFIRKLSGVENLIHVNLINESKTLKTSHTLMYINREWLVIEGLHGEPKRIYTMGVKDAVLFQKKIFYAIKKNNFKNWMLYAKWYKKWRQEISITY